MHTILMKHEKERKFGFMNNDIFIENEHKDKVTQNNMATITVQLWKAKPQSPDCNWPIGVKDSYYVWMNSYELVNMKHFKLKNLFRGTENNTV